MGVGGFAGTPVEKAFKEHTPDATAFDAYLEKMKVLKKPNDGGTGTRSDSEPGQNSEHPSVVVHAER